MTQDNIMGNLETWVRQLNGELNVSQYSKSSMDKSKPDYVMPYYAFFRSIKRTVGLTAVTNKNRHSACNVEFTFDGHTHKLKAVRMINDGN